MKRRTKGLNCSVWSRHLKAREEEDRDISKWLAALRRVYNGVNHPDRRSAGGKDE